MNASQYDWYVDGLIGIMTTHALKKTRSKKFDTNLHEHIK